LKDETRGAILAVAKQSHEVAADLHRKIEVTRKDIEEIAEVYSGKKSSFLVGVAGAVFGGVGGGFALHGALIAVGGPVGAALGAALLLLAWRGPNQWRLERANDRMRIALDAIQARIAMLSQDKTIPHHLINDWWDAYSVVQKKYLAVIERVIDDGQ
jgi:hypothetical protein